MKKKSIHNDCRSTEGVGGGGGGGVTGGVGQPEMEYTCLIWNRHDFISTHVFGLGQELLR